MVRGESLVPAGCEQGSIDHFFENGDALNQQMQQRFDAAREMGLVLRHVARFDANGKARVGVEAVRPEHPLASLLPCDNVFAIESRWYRDNPLVIRGPGAGRDVTAGAIQSDLNRLTQLLKFSRGASPRPRTFPAKLMTAVFIIKFFRLVGED